MAISILALIGRRRLGMLISTPTRPRRLLNLHSGNTPSATITGTRLQGHIMEAIKPCVSTKLASTNLMDTVKRNPILDDLQLHSSSFNKSPTNSVYFPLKIYGASILASTAEPNWAKVVCPGVLPIFNRIIIDEDQSKLRIDPKSPARPAPSIEKRAARLIKIRRKKMRKHKLRKFRKRTVHLYAKNRQRREAKKEKIFQDELLEQMSRADEFDARAWVHEFLLKSTTDPQSLVPEKPKMFRPTRYVL